MSSSLSRGPDGTAEGCKGVWLHILLNEQRSWRVACWRAGGPCEGHSQMHPQENLSRMCHVGRSEPRTSVFI